MSWLTEAAGCEKRHVEKKTDGHHSAILYRLETLTAFWVVVDCSSKSPYVTENG